MILFTERGGQNATVTATPILDKILPVLTIIGIGVFAMSQFTRLPMTPAILLIGAGTIHLLRLLHWDPLSTRKVPYFGHYNWLIFFLA